MSRIVRETYPVERLPADLRPASTEVSYVRVVIEGAEDQAVLADFHRKIEEGIADLDAGRSHSTDEVRDFLKARFGTVEAAE